MLRSKLTINLGAVNIKVMFLICLDRESSLRVLIHDVFSTCRTDHRSINNEFDDHCYWPVQKGFWLITAFKPYLKQ